MGWWLTMRRVMLPQAFKIVLPPYGNIMIMMLKDSSQASTITVAELALQGKLIASSTFKNTSVFTLVALIYLTMSIPLILLVRWLREARGPEMMAMIELQRPQELWQGRGAQGHHGVRREGRGGLHHRSLGVRQVHDPALHQRAREL